MTPLRALRTRPARRRRRRVARSLSALVLAASAAGCAVGPDYHPPEPPVVGGYTPTPLPEATTSTETPHGEAQAFVAGRDIPAEWWSVFHSEALDALVRRALAESPTLVAAEARLRKAQEDLKAHKGATQWPSVNATLGAERVDIQPESLGVVALPIETPFNLYFASAGVSYTLDLFGGNRRELEALQALVDYQRFEREGARLMLAGNVVTSAIREASLREQIASTVEILGVQERQLGIAERLETAGTLSRADVTAQRIELSQARARLPGLQLRLEQVRHRLAVLSGRPPDTQDLPEFRLDDLSLPIELPVTLPSELARRRPDIQAAEALLHEASARVGVATASFYPKIPLSAHGGSLATAIGSVFGAGTGFYLLAASLAQPIFHGGELKAKKRAAVAAFEQAGAAYQEVLLVGFQNVADILRALEADARILHETAEAANEARDYHDITARRFEVGGVSRLEMLEAQRQYQRATLERTRAVADRLADSAALFQALGGGWWQEEPAATPAAPPAGSPAP
jgi:NodT family efflux transporter outer membrane factor (OMF) lipoprotein